jgi:DNA-binding PadR family transcriptional regulator
MRHVFLSLLVDEPRHGYELKRNYDALVAPVWPPLNVGQAYVTLGRLERDGLVTHRTEAQTDRPDRKVYELTELGRKELEEWLSAPSDPATVKSEVVLKLIAARAAGAPVTRSLVAEHRQRCLEALRRLDNDAATVPAGSVADLLVQGSALHLQAELRWLDLVAQHAITSDDVRTAAPTGADHARAPEEGAGDEHDDVGESDDGRTDDG